MARSNLRRQIEQAVKDGRLVKPTTCDKCEARPSSSRRIWAHVPNIDAPLDVTWLCALCWNAVAEKKPTVQPKRKQNIKKAPPYEQMKADYLDGWSYPELAKRWNISSAAAAWHLMRDRAVAHGDWPLPKQPPKRIKVNVIWDLVRSELAKRTDAPIVVVAQKEADRFAPLCRFRQRKKDGGMTRTEVWPTSSVPRYHRPHCRRLIPAGDAVFALPREEADDWGYESCKICSVGIALDEYARRNDFKVDWVYGLNRGQVTHVSLAQARALLRSIDEPIPDTLYTKAEIAARKARRAAASKRVDGTRPAN